MFCLLWVNRSYKALDDKTGHSRYYLPAAKVEEYNVMINGRNFFDQPIEKDIKTYENVRKTTIGQGDGYTTGYLLDSNYFKEHKMVSIDLSKQQGLDADPRAIQQINFTENLSSNNNTSMVFITEEAKK